MLLTWLQHPLHQMMLLTVLCVGLAVGVLVLARHLRTLKRQLTDLQQAQQQFAEQLVALQQIPSAPAAPGTAVNLPFSQQLQQVEQQVERPVPASRSTPEKYRYVAALAAQGMTAEQIAQALRISPAEAEQTIQLARLSEPGG